MNTQYELTISSTIFEQTRNASVQEKNRCAKKVTGNWYPEYVRLIQITEGHNYELKASIARINENAKRSDAPYFTSNLVCKYNGCECKYQLTKKNLLITLF